MKRFLFSIVLVLFLFAQAAWAEDRPAGQMILKLPTTTNDPELTNGHVYPNWGPVCQRYTYSVIYRDKEGRPPEYVRIYFNGKMIDMEKANQADSDYKKGIRYEYKFVPTKIGSNFYYFEASNGLGKDRDSIIDSPDNGPVLFESAFDKNEVAVVEVATGEKILEFNTGKECIGGVAMSDDGRYLAVKASSHIYLFDTTKPRGAVWTFSFGREGMIGDVKGGVDISADGSRIFASIGPVVLLFGNRSNKPLWEYEIGQSAYNVAISADGNYAAVATAGEEANEQSNLLVLWNTKNKNPLWQYHASGNFHDVSLSSDGAFVAGATGCPDRRAYVFSRDSKNPVMKSETLTQDSPVHRAKISADGSLVAYGTESGAGGVYLFERRSNKPLWGFLTPNGSSVRALNFTPDGNYIGAATFAGQVYIFGRESGQPLASWQLSGAMGGIDIADDGSFVAVGGTDRKLHILAGEDKKELFTVPFDEYLEEIDISANKQYVAAGTGGSVYFFETIFDLEGKTFSCSEIIEPSPEPAMNGINLNRQSGEDQPTIIYLFHRIINFFKGILGMGVNQEQTVDDRQESDGKCGNNLCEPDFGETKESCSNDCTMEN